MKFVEDRSYILVAHLIAGIVNWSRMSRSLMACEPRDHRRSYLFWNGKEAARAYQSALVSMISLNIR